MASEAWSIKTQTHHLLRVWLRRRVFEQLKEIAKEQSVQRKDVRVSVSDLVRAAVNDWLLIHEQAARLGHLVPPITGEPGPEEVEVENGPTATPDEGAR